jgi:hypothetical protein
MEIHVLYDNRRVEKWEPLMEEFRQQGIDPTKIWEPVFAKTVVESINLSHKAIVRYAKDNNLKEVCIIEDDCFWPARDGWQYFLNKKPDEFDIYLAGCYARILLDGDISISRTKMSNGMIYCGEQIKGFTGLHCYIISNKYYDTFLATTQDGHIDTLQDGRGDFVVCHPMAALQRPGWSSNNMAQVNYNSPQVIKPEWVYDGAVHNL